MGQDRNENDEKQNRIIIRQQRVLIFEIRPQNAHKHTHTYEQIFQFPTLNMKINTYN